MRRVVSELSQRFVSVRDLPAAAAPALGEIEELVSKLEKDGMLMTPCDAAGGQPVRRLAPVVAGCRRARHGSRMALSARLSPRTSKRPTGRFLHGRERFERPPV